MQALKNFGLAAVGLLVLIFIGYLIFANLPASSSGGRVAGTQTCPAGYTCTPVQQAGAVRHQRAVVVHQPALTQPAWKTCLSRLGILDKCRVRNGDVECRQSVAHLARQCGV